MSESNNHLGKVRNLKSNSDPSFSVTVPTHTPEQEAEARALAMIKSAQGPVDHEPARRALAKLPQAQLDAFDRSMRSDIRAILSQNASILNASNPNGIDKEA